MKFLRVLLILSLTTNTFASTITGVTTSNGVEYVVTGSDFITVPTYENYSYMDDWTAPTVYTEGVTADPTGTDGNIVWVSDVNDDDATACVAIDVTPFGIVKSASNFSTGFGLTQGVCYRFSAGPSVMNWAFKFDLNTPSTDELWYRCYIYMEDINPPGAYAPNTHKIGFLWYKRVGGSGNRTFVPGMAQSNASFYAVNQSATDIDPTGWSYNYTDVPGMLTSHPGAGKWFELTMYHKLNTFVEGVDQGGAEVKMYINGELIFDYATEVPTAANRSIANETNSNMDRLEFGGNISGGTQSWLDPGEGGSRLFDDFVASRSGYPKSIPCVYLSNSPTWGAGVTDRWNGDANFVRQVVGGVATLDQGFNSWSDTEMKFQKNTTGLDTSLPIYLYATNWDGDTNSSGLIIPGAESAIIGAGAIVGNGAILNQP